MLKITTCGRQTSCLFTKRGLGFEKGATVKQIQVMREDLNSAARPPRQLYQDAKRKCNMASDEGLKHYCTTVQQCLKEANAHN